MFINGFSKCIKYRIIANGIKSCSTQSKTETLSKIAQIKNGPGLKEFLIAGKNIPAPNSRQPLESSIPYLYGMNFNGGNRKVYFEVYGCQMNVNDTEVVWSILKDSGYQKVDDVKDSDVVLLITCAIREKAETKIWNRLKHLTAMKENRSSKRGQFQIGILGCMAERLKVDILEKEKLVDVVAGPDSYKDLPRLLSISKKSHQKVVNVLLSHDETYADVVPIRLNENSVTAFLSIMRGCDNMCSYCIVPFTRGKERSRDINSILNEVKILEHQGVKEITLLGQNVNSYRDLSSDPVRNTSMKIVPGFHTVYKDKIGGLRFAELLERVATMVPNARIRFTSPHPKDFPDDVIKVIKAYPNICKSIHLPVQSGSSEVLSRMRRGYTRESYLDLVNEIRKHIPDVTLSSDFICGFCGETENEFAETISMIDTVKYNVAYLFAYSMREKTTAFRRYKDDVPYTTKIDRLNEMVATFRKCATKLQSTFIGKTELILIEGISKRSSNELFGRNDGNIKVIVPSCNINGRKISVGDFVSVKITYSNSQILKGEPLAHTTITEYYK